MAEIGRRSDDADGTICRVQFTDAVTSEIVQAQVNAKDPDGLSDEQLIEVLVSTLANRER
jgi:hypothetical protein